MSDNIVVLLLVSIIVVLLSVIAIMNAIEASQRREMTIRHINVCDEIFKAGYELGRGERKA